MKIHIGKFMIDLTQEKGKYSPKKIGSSVSVALLVIGSLAMIAMFFFHVIVDHAPPDYVNLGIGLGALGIGSGGGALLHSKSTGESP